MTLKDLSHLQFHTNNVLGFRLINAATHKRLGTSKTRPPFPPAMPALTGEVLNDIIALGSHALIAHLSRLLVKDPVRVILESDTLTRIRVCDALDYVIDRTNCQVWAEPAPLSVKEQRATQQPPWYHPLNGKSYNVDLLNPLRQPLWLNYIAARPGWFGYAFSRHKGTQKQLFIEQDEMAYALRMVVRAAWCHFVRDKAFIALRHLLASTLAMHLGAGVVTLAMRSRLRTDIATLDARHMSLVLRHQQAYETMARENPKVLPALTAWLRHEGNDQAVTHLKVLDALPLLRRDLLANGLGPQAWRYLVRHGYKLIQFHNLPYNPWACLVQTLRALSAARWPPLPPRGFLRLLHDTAGHPIAYEHACDGNGAGWFWQVACIEATACQGDTAEYNCLCDLIPQWAWMLRHYQLKPDKNQRRKGREWLELMTDAVESRALQDDTPEWALWLPAVGWADIHKLKAVPLQSIGALQQEAFALHNCTDAFEDRCRAESHVLISLRLWGTDKPVALVCVERRGCNWVLGQVAGPCNRAVRAWVQQLAQQATEWVRYYHGQRPAVTAAPPEDTATDDIHLLLIDP